MSLAEVKPFFPIYHRGIVNIPSGVYDNANEETHHNKGNLVGSQQEVFMWKEYPYNNNYLVSDDGRIKSKRFNKILTPKKNWDGYLRIQIWKDNKNRFVSWHRIIAETYVPNPENKPFINHKNGNKQDNRAENLEWCTQQENIIHAWKTGLSKSHNNDKKLSKPVIQLDLFDNVIGKYPSMMEAERQTGINHSNICYACKHLSVSKGYKWRYAETCND